MTSSTERRPNYTRRFVWLVVAIVLVIAGYSAAWHYAADFVAARVTETIARANSDGRRANCENPQVRGYPFRIGLFCQSVLFEDGRAGLGVRARALRSAAQVYSPRHIIAELDGPATVQAPGINALELRWASLRSSTRLAAPLPEILSVEGSDLTVAMDEPGDASPPVAHADNAQFHLRPNGSDVDVAVRFRNLELVRSILGGAYLPPLTGLADVTIREGLTMPPSGASPLRGRSAFVRDLNVSVSEETGASMRGRVSVDQSGFVDGELEITLRNPRELARVIGELLPDSRQQIELGLSALGSGGAAATLPLRIVKGDVSLGFLPLGSIPPL